MKTDKLLDKCFYIIGWVFIAIGAAAFLLYHAGILPSIRIAPCMIHSMTGYYCPGCGGTRATYALLHGKIITSLYYHPIVVYGVVVGGWFMISQTIERLSRGKLSGEKSCACNHRDCAAWIILTVSGKAAGSDHCNRYRTYPNMPSRFRRCYRTLQAQKQMLQYK